MILLAVNFFQLSDGLMHVSFSAGSSDACNLLHFFCKQHWMIHHVFIFSHQIVPAYTTTECSLICYSAVGRFAKLYYYLLATDQQYICACITMAFRGEIYKYDVKG